MKEQEGRQRDCEVGTIPPARGTAASVLRELASRLPAARVPGGLREAPRDTGCSRLPHLDSVPVRDSSEAQVENNLRGREEKGG